MSATHSSTVRLDNYFTYERSEGGARVDVWADRRAGRPVSERLFGLFTEHLGKNVYGGAWAQALANGGFEPFDAVLDDVPETHRKDVLGATKARLALAAAQFDMPGLVDFESLGLAPYWSPAGDSGASYSLVPGLNGKAQAIRSTGGAAGIETPLFLPLHRVDTYDFQVHVRTGALGAGRDAGGNRPSEPRSRVQAGTRPVAQSGGQSGLRSAAQPGTRSDAGRRVQPALRIELWHIGGPEEPPQRTAGAPFGLDHGGPIAKGYRERLLACERIRLDLPVFTPGRWTKARALLRADTAGVPKGARLKFRLWVEGLPEIAFDQALLFPTDAIAGWDPEVVQLLRDAKVSVLRFPGGNFASGYHWEDGVGPIERRPEKPNPAWHEWEPNHVGTDEWLALCELIGAEPLICVNAGNGTPEEAANWVRYCNDPETTPWGQKRAANGHPAPYNVRLWEVGNEIWGDFQIGWTNAEEYGARFGRFAEAMKAADPSIDLIAVGGAMPLALLADGARRRPDLLGAEYARRAVLDHGPHVWAIAEHAVMGGVRLREVPPEDAYLSLIAHTHHVGELLRQNKERLAALKSDAVVAQTEQMVAVSGPDRPTDESLAAAVVWAGFMNWFLRSDGFVPLFTRSAMINHGDFLEKVRGIVYPLPGYYAQAMYAAQPGRIPVAAHARTPVMDIPGSHFLPAEVPCIDVAALLGEDDATLVALAANRHPSAKIAVDFAVHAFEAGRVAEVQVLAGPSYSSRNSWDAPDHVKPVKQLLPVRDGVVSLSLPPHSVVVVAFSRAKPGEQAGKEDGGASS